MRGSSDPGMALGFLREPQGGVKVPLPGGSSLQLSSLQGRGCPQMLSVFWGAPQGHPQICIFPSWGHPGDPSPLTLPLVLPSPLRVHLGCPMCLTVPLGAAWEPLCAPQDTPPSSWCLSGHPRESPLAFWCSLCVPFSSFLGPFGAPCTLQ